MTHTSISVPGAVPTIVLSYGGSLVLNSSDDSNRSARLLSLSGNPWSFFRDGETLVAKGSQTIEHLTPGAYSLQLLDKARAVTRTIPVNIVEGQTTTVNL